MNEGAPTSEGAPTGQGAATSEGAPTGQGAGTGERAATTASTEARGGGAMRLKFLGAAGTVTGSKYLVEAGERRVLVDCGLFQGLKQLRLRNRRPFPVEPSSIDAVVLTHAHIDHTGYLPLLVREGFSGPIYCTAATRDLCAILLPDSGHLQEEEAEFANRHGFSRHHPALPLYTEADARQSLQSFRAVERGVDFEVAAGVTAHLERAGHILGSSLVRLRASGGEVLFSGDLGRPDGAVLLPPAQPRHAANLVLESTYGDRTHGGEDAQALLGEVVRRTASRGGVVVIPAFAVGRTQVLLYHLHRLAAENAIPRLPIFLDSPMATKVTHLYARYPDEHRLTAEQWRDVEADVQIVNGVEESKAVDRRRGPMIVVSASGMATGGRVIHHLKVFAPDHRNTVLFAGYQAAGTRGAAMLAGAQTIKIHGQHVPVRAEVVALHGLSAHADADELIAWLGHFEAPPRHTYLTHGEPEAADALRRRIEETLHWSCSVAEEGESVDVGG